MARALHFIASATLALAFNSSLFAQTGRPGWFAFSPTPMQPNSAPNLSSWLDAPAGKHGALTMKGENYQFEDGTPVKFWGVNIAGELPFMDKEKDAEWTKQLAAYGINAVRLHKFTWEATDGIHSTQLTPEKWDRLDHFQAALRKAGIYYGWSHIYGHRVLPADSSRLLAYSGIKNSSFPWSHLNGTTSSLVNFAEDLQALNIELTVNMLNHVNPVSGLRYADDPALDFIELQNEDDIFWSAIEVYLQQAPSYRKLLCQKFSSWLKQKYGNQQALERAWQGKGLENGASMDQGNIYPNPNHGLFTAAWQKAQEQHTTYPAYLADRVSFLFEEQLHFYQKFVKAIRLTGYKGVIIGSCWQAGSGITHYFNLYTDYVAGAIDRHNYFGGGSGHLLKPGKFDNSAMVSRPGSGLLSTGFQQVADRPFQLSEWMSLIPNEWVAESAPMVAAFGLGLQGWDASYAFAMDHTEFTNTLESGHGIYNVTSPLQLALYPALAAMIYRKDIREGPVVANRTINIEELKKGKVLASDQLVQDYDRKSLVSVVPSALLASGRVVITLTNRDPSSVFLSDTADAALPAVVRSNTGQLEWHTGKNRFFTINSPGTKAVVGFARDSAVQLGNFTISTTDTFAVIFVNSIERNADLEHTRRILITVMARAANTDMEFNADHTELLNTGHAPLLLEPVKATIRLSRHKGATVYVLDHGGNRTGTTVPIAGDSVLLDGSVYKTLYYEVAY